MQRELAHFQRETFDLAIVGGGIYGACLAWDAALRGLRVALVERGDFGQATSANSLKTIHGGLRYLQDGNLPLVRRMIRERRAFLRIAPHLVQPLACAMPTTPRLLRSKAAMGAALAANDLMGLDRNRGLPPHQRLPASRLLSRAEMLELAPGLAGSGLTGGALWHDGQVYNSERLTLAFVRGAAARGASVANYVEATDLMLDRERVAGIQARDVLGGEAFVIRAHTVVAAAGPWLDTLLGKRATPGLSTAMNLVTRQIRPDCALGVPGEGGRMLFIAPWRHVSIVGTHHAPFRGDPAHHPVDESMVDDLLCEVNRAYPEANLALEDVYLVHWGLLPAEKGREESTNDEVTLVRDGRVVDHAREGLPGLFSLLGVKYTLARHVAEQAADRVCRALKRPPTPCITATTPVWGGDFASLEDLLTRAERERPPTLPPAALAHLARCHGSHLPRLFAYMEETPALGQPLGPDTRVIGAEVVHAVREEMAHRLADVVLRRTELGSAGPPHPLSLRACADLMADEVGWSPERTADEIAAVLDHYPAWTRHAETLPLEAA